MSIEITHDESKKVTEKQTWHVHLRQPFDSGRHPPTYHEALEDRDAAIARAEKAERERDHWESEARRCVESQTEAHRKRDAALTALYSAQDRAANRASERDAAIAERDRTREECFALLERYADALGQVQDALAAFSAAGNGPPVPMDLAAATASVCERLLDVDRILKHVESELGETLPGNRVAAILLLGLRARRAGVR